MLQYEIDMILKAFLKCFGLKDALAKYVKLNDSAMIDECVEQIAKHSGLRETFIKDNLTEILTLGN
jgi:hypothetical protein